MRKHSGHSIMRAGLTAPAILFAVALVACGGSSSGSQATNAAKTLPGQVQTADNATLGQTILVNSRGRTLYSLSAEKGGRFICTDSTCLSLWKPLVVRAGAKPTGAVGSLGTVRRPDGKTQVTYRRRPLYTFTEDMKKGDVKGDGFKDVGVWHPVAVSGKTSNPPPTTPGGY